MSVISRINHAIQGLISRVFTKKTYLRIEPAEVMKAANAISNLTMICRQYELENANLRAATDVFLKNSEAAVEALMRADEMNHYLIREAQHLIYEYTENCEDAQLQQEGQTWLARSRVM